MKVSLEQLPDHARVWIYQHVDKIPTADQLKIQIALEDFVSVWSAHNQPLAAHGRIEHDRFIILIVDEGQNLASGCSIDSSVHFIKTLEATFGLNLFDRMLFSYQKEGEVHTVTKDEFVKAYVQGDIDDQTLVFDNLIKTKRELQDNWLKPLMESWHHRFVKAVSVK